MAKYTVIEMQNGTIEGRSWVYEAREKAETKMFQVLAETVESTVAVHTVMLVTDEGHVLETRCYHHETEQA